jgi:polyisoprenoid-binding protein YceI
MTTHSPTVSVVPGYVTGTWDIDPVHSEVSFVVRHMVVSKVRGRFDKFEGVIVTAEDPLASSVEATISAGSINTNQEQRDAHIRSADFLDVDNHPDITFRSLAVRPAGDHFVLDGDLLGARGERLLARSLRGHAGRILGHHRDQPQRLRSQLQRAHPRC